MSTAKPAGSPPGIRGIGGPPLTEILVSGGRRITLVNRALVAAALAAAVRRVMPGRAARTIKDPACPPDSLTREEARRAVEATLRNRRRSKAAMTAAGKGLTSR